jgi:DNA-binding NarL/FixJ family response regulator
VVLVDDVDDYRRLVRVALRLRGTFEVVGEAADGLSAVDVVAATRPDVVVLDLGLPDLSAREVISRIRSVSPESGVVVFTGTYLQDKLGLRRLVEGYVLKDLDVDLLVRVLTDVGVSAATRAPVTLELPHDPRSVREARRYVAEQCRQWKLEELTDDAQLVVAELVTNAVVHTDGGCTLRLFRSGARLRIEVIDHGAGSPDMKNAGSEDEHGRGLLLVSMLTGAWGVEPTPKGGKRVWGDLLSMAS